MWSDCCLILVSSQKMSLSLVISLFFIIIFSIFYRLVVINLYLFSVSLAADTTWQWKDCIGDQYSQNWSGSNRRCHVDWFRRPEPEVWVWSRTCLLSWINKIQTKDLMRTANKVKPGHPGCHQAPILSPAPTLFYATCKFWMRVDVANMSFHVCSCNPGNACCPRRAWTTWLKHGRKKGKDIRASGWREEVGGEQQMGSGDMRWNRSLHWILQVLWWK